MWTGSETRWASSMGTTGKAPSNRDQFWTGTVPGHQWRFQYDHQTKGFPDISGTLTVWRLLFRRQGAKQQVCRLCTLHTNDASHVRNEERTTNHRKGRRQMSGRSLIPSVWWQNCRRYQSESVGAFCRGVAGQAVPGGERDAGCGTAAHPRLAPPVSTELGRGQCGISDRVGIGMR